MIYSRQDIQKCLLALLHESTEPLQSVRSLARTFQVSPATVHKVLQELCREGVLESVSRKGYRKSAKQVPPVPGEKLVRPDLVSAIGDALLQDYRRGIHNPFQPLPMQKVLATRYGTSPSGISKTLRDLHRRGLIISQGRRWFWSTRQPTISRNTIIVIQRCNQKGHLLMDSDRETSFLKACYRECENLNIRIQVLGWCDNLNSEVLIDSNGSLLHIKEASSETLGFIISSWLMNGINDLLSSLARLRIPMAVWWEHPRKNLRGLIPKNRRIAYFDLAFGQSPGLMVGRHLVIRGCQKIWFVSPFHAAEWSRNRWKGLSTLLGQNQITPKLLANNEFASAHALTQDGRKIENEVRHLLNQHSLQEPPDAIVCVSDSVAVPVLQWLQRNSLTPYVVSFDNSDLSYRLRLDSFEFNTEGMVRNMLHFLLTPSLSALKSADAHELSGHLVLK